MCRVVRSEIVGLLKFGLETRVSETVVPLPWRQRLFPLLHPLLGMRGSLVALNLPQIQSRAASFGVLIGKFHVWLASGSDQGVGANSEKVGAWRQRENCEKIKFRVDFEMDLFDVSLKLI